MRSTRRTPVAWRPIEGLERLHDISRGATETLVKHGFIASRLGPVLAAMLAAGCATQRGRGWDTPALAPTAPAVSLLLLGEVGHPGRTAGQVAAEVRRTLAARRAAGVPVILLWLGDALGDTCDLTTSLARPGVRDFADLAREHQAAGSGSYAVLGVHEWRCGAPSVHVQPDTGPRPWRMPAANYVVRVARDGTSTAVSKCSEHLCTVEPATDGALVDLVLLDTTAWLGPAARGGPLLTAADASLVQQQALLAALEATPSTVPRLLVTHHPVETAGPHGQGGLFPDSAYGLHPEPLRRAISHGVFAGALSGRDRNISASADIFDAVKRSSRFWLPHPMFQVVSGATAHPDGSASGGRRSWLYYQSQSLMPDLFSNRAGFAELIVGPETYAAQLHQRRRGRWRAAQIEVPRERPPHPVETPSPVMDPCLRCDPLRPNQ